MHIDDSIFEQTISILIELGSNPSYIAPVFVEMCILKNSKLRRSWLVQLATRTKEKGQWGGKGMSIGYMFSHLVLMTF